MKLKSNFSCALDFKPSQTWPDTVPAIALEQELLCGFQLNNDHPVFEHPFQNPEQALKLLKSVHPQLTWPELARLFMQPAFKNFFEATDVFKAYGFFFSPDLEQILNLIVQTPAEFQEFVMAKKVGALELQPLVDLPKASQDFVVHEVLKAEESKQESVQRIELLSDLIQMGQNLAELENMKLQALIQKRYPVTASRDQSLQASELPWLSQIKRQFKRRGDKAGFEVHFLAGTPAELNKLAQNLSRVAEAWNVKP